MSDQSPERYWYRGVVQYDGGPPEGYYATTSETAALEYVWAGYEEMRDGTEADAYWVERRPVDCWERIKW